MEIIQIEQYKKSREPWAHPGSDRGGGHKLPTLDSIKSSKEVSEQFGYISKIYEGLGILSTKCKEYSSIALNE